MSTQSISTGGGKGHALGCACPFCTSNATTGEAFDVDLTAPAPTRGLNDAEALIHDAEYYLTDLSRDFEADVAEAFPALAGVVRDTGFREEYLHPLTRAVHERDEQQAEHLAQRIVDLNTAEQRYLDSGWKPAEIAVTDQDNYYGARYTGSKYVQSRPLTEVAKDMRTDIKAAAAAGYIRDDLTYRVTKDDNSLRIIVENMPDEDSLWRDRHSPYAHGREFVTRPSWEANRLTDRLKAIGSAYAYSQSSGMADYSSVSHHVFVEVRKEGETMFWAHEKELAEIRRRGKGLTDEGERQALLTELRETQARQGAERSIKREHDRQAWDW